MKIAIDARELTGRATGVGRYLAELLAEWARTPEAQRHDWRLYSPVPPPVPEPFRSAIRVLPGKGGTAWEQWTFARALAADKPDLLFAPGYTAPLTAPCPVVLTIHDVSFCAVREWFSWREGLRRRTLTAWSARRARIVLTDTEFSRAEIAKHTGVPPDRIHVVPLGIRQRTPSAGTRGPMVLFVGSIFTRRNVDRLIDAFARHVVPVMPEARLEIAGENRSYPFLDLPARLAQYPADVRAKITLRDYVDDTTLHRLYAEARVFAFPSAYEGFGFGPLEALAAGVPPVVMRTPVASEVYGAAARYVDGTAASIGQALLDLLTSDSARAAVLREAPAVLARYDWGHTAAATLTILQEAARV